MTTQSTQVPVGVIGCGRMGKLHARVYSQMPGTRLVGVFDADFDTADAVAAEYKTKPFTSLEELLEQVQAVTIAVPTSSHVRLAEQCLRRKIACLIEKPLARNVEECRRIAQWARESGAVVQVGHIERFNPAFRAMRRLNIDPRFIEVSRISPLSFRSIDVGVVLDMMIHDLDILLTLAASPVTRIDACGVSVIGDTEDICNARLTFANGCVANVTASRLALKTERKLRVFSPDAYVSLDYQKRYALVARRSGNVETIREAVRKIREGEIADISALNYADLVQVEEPKIDDVEPIRAELDAFLHAITTGSRPECSAEDGLAAVDLAERIVQAMSTQKVV